MPKMTPHPVPKKRFHGARWRIYWKWNTRQYTLATDFMNAKKTAGIDSDLRLVSAALAMDMPIFPDKYADNASVQTYLADRGLQELSEIPDNDAMLTEYDRQISAVCGKEWAQNSRVRLNSLSGAAGGILNTTPALAHKYLTDIVDSGRTPATRNRALNVFNRFFKWTVDLGYVKTNPFAGIKLLKEAREEQIVYCTRSERARLINLAKNIGFKDWIAVPIAFYTGMRMEEIYRMRWDDIRWKEGRVVVPITKTKKSRTLDLSSKLRGMLNLVPVGQRQGFVVPEIEGIRSRRDRAQTLTRQLRKLMAQETNPIPEERISWNAWRHTFASLLVQEGVGLDQVSEWMGNTPEVCRRHYAQFIPRDKRNSAIDKL